MALSREFTRAEGKEAAITVTGKGKGKTERESAVAWGSEASGRSEVLAPGADQESTQAQAGGSRGKAQRS